MEIWLSMLDDRFRLPILPSSFELTVANMNETVTINNFGEINLIGKSTLKELELSSFFPAQEYYFNEYRNILRPFQIITKLEKWRLSGQPIRVIVTGTHINLVMSIESFVYGERDGTKDVYYSLSLKEYKRVKTIQPKSSKGYVKPATKRPAPTPPKRTTYTVKKGDNLWNIAKKHTGNAMNWKKIYADNKKVIGGNPNLIRPGQKLII